MKAILPVAIACALALSSCSDRNAANDADADATRPADTAADATDTPPAQPATPDEQPVAGGDGAALGLLAAINQHEIDAAAQAKSKGVDGDVLAYAEMMEKEHGTNQEKTRTLGPDENAPDVVAQKQKGKAELDALAAQSGDAYEKAYIDAMVKGHEEALAAIDGKMIPMATRDDVRQHFAETRKAVAMHLDHARELAGKL